MAVEVREYAPVIPAGTVQAAPVSITLPMPVRTVERIDWRVPKGAAGLVGWQLAMGGVQVLPTAGVTWMIADGQASGWAVQDLPDSGAWQLIGYNTGNYPHAVYLTFHVGMPVRRLAVLPALTPAELSEAPDLSHAGPPLKAPPWPF